MDRNSSTKVIPITNLLSQFPNVQAVARRPPKDEFDGIADTMLLSLGSTSQAELAKWMV